jgi:hypothetical protein
MRCGHTAQAFPDSIQSNFRGPCPLCNTQPTTTVHKSAQFNALLDAPILRSLFGVLCIHQHTTRCASVAPGSRRLAWRRGLRLVEQRVGWSVVLIADPLSRMRTLTGVCHYL